MSCLPKGLRCECKVDLKSFGKQTIGNILNLIICCSIIISWYFTKSWELNNLLAVSLVLLTVRTV